MSASQAAIDRVDRTRARLDKFLDFRVHREMHAYADEQRDRDVERRDRLQRHDAARRRHAARYDEAYASWGQVTPQPEANEYPGDYRRRLFRGLQDKLPLDHDLEGIDPNELDRDVIEKFEPQLIEAVTGEGEQPTGSNLPDSVNHPRARRERMDSATGARTIDHFAKRSFIFDMKRPSRKVLRIVNPKTGDVLWGRPFSRPPTP